MDSKKPVVMIVDGYADLLQAMENLNDYMPHVQFVTAMNIREAKEKFTTNRDLLTSIFVDSYLIDFIEWAKSQGGPSFLTVGVYCHSGELPAMRRVGCDHCVCKPFSVEEFWYLVHKGEKLYLTSLSGA